MISLIQHIEYLMMYHDCVVVPGWGALIANYTSPQVSGENIARPNRTISYNSRITHNDGLLATSLCRRHNMTYDKACRFIDDNVIAFRQQLNTGIEVAFGHLGYFKHNDKNTIEFMPIHAEMACDEFFGLNNLEFFTLAQSDSSNKATITMPVNITLRERMKVAASIAAIIGLGVLFSTPAIVNNSAQNASFNVTEVKTKPVQQVVTVKPVSQTTAGDVKFELINDKQDSDVEESPFNEGMPNNGNYCLIINTCNKSKQASDIIKNYAKRGIKAVEVTRGKYHHIVVAKSYSKKELIKAKKLLPEKYRHAWISK